MEIGNLLFGNSRGNVPIPRGAWQTSFQMFFENLGLDSYGYVPRNASDYLKAHQTKYGGFENEVFLVQPYYWGEDDEVACLPNFVFKATGYSLQWYKYPLRDAYASFELSFEDFVTMLKTCLNSIKK
jgi:hypothetical protein